MRPHVRGRDRRILLCDALRGFTHPALAYTRSQQIYCRQQDGTLRAFAAQALPRQHHATRGWHFRMNQGYTQYLLRNTALSNAAWTVTGLNTPTQNTTGPDGVANGTWTVSESTANSAHQESQSVSYTTGVTYNFQAIIAPGSGTRLLTLVLPAAAFGSDAIATFNPADGTATANGTVLSTTSEQLASGYWLVSMNATATATAPGTTLFALHRTATATVDSYTGDGTSSVKVFGVAIVDVGYPAPFLSSAGSTTNVGGHTWGSTLANMNLNVPGDYTMAAEFWADAMAGTYPTRMIMQLDNNSANERAGLRYNGVAAGLRAISVTGGTLTTIDSFSINEGVFVRQALGVAKGLHLSAANGTLGTGATPTPPAGLTNLRLGGDTGSNQLNGGLVRAWLLPSAAFGGASLLVNARA